MNGAEPGFAFAGCLTKREYFAAMAMQGLIIAAENTLPPDDIAAIANDVADAMIESAE